MSATSPNPDYTREVRFAVVMYGGVSLAIYINGIAQELLRLVRATAPQSDGKPKSISGTERVYRKVSYLLAQRNKEYRPGEANDVSEDVVKDPERVPPTRFVVDILSGTSAGGINGIFLAKALANGQDIQQLKDLWVQEGDIERLINDKKSIEPPLAIQRTPTSLLNSERMYFELLKAFDGMDKQCGELDDDAESPLVDELDLFITSTDLQGVVLPIRLSDKLVYERRHRNMLRFVYSSPKISGEDKPRNDFQKKYNPFLAYAARCTSSFPFAFEPMLLSDADKILERLRDYHQNDDAKAMSPLWHRFYKDYSDPRTASSLKFPKRAFGDGGYLDNKPFSYATDMLMNRNADVPVDRKLIYIEPSPEHPEDEVETEWKPDAIENVMAAVVKLPRYETIREDLQRIKERNRLIERVNSIAAGVDRDSAQVKGPRSKSVPGSEKEWQQFGALASPPLKERWSRPVILDEDTTAFDVTDMIKRKGRSYSAYHRLRIASVTDELAKTIARVADFDENSDYFLIVRYLVRGWRVTRYREYRRDDDDRPNQSKFLFEFDLSYPIRRVNYLRSKVDALYRLDKDAIELIKDVANQSGIALPELNEEQQQIFRNELLAIKIRLNKVFTSLRRAAREVRSRRTINEPKDQTARARVSPIRDEVKDLINKISNEVQKLSADKNPKTAFLNYFLAISEESSARHESVETKCKERAVDLLENNNDILDLFDQTAEALKSVIEPVKRKAERDLIAVFASTAASPCTETSLTSLARHCIGHYYNNYEDYDLLIYPLLYDTDVGEADIIDIIRISPEDAVVLINEIDSGCHKLAGSSLGHFGAFLQRSWRENDILWGRLDGAERIISALLPKHEKLGQLIGEAHGEIICETLSGMGETERYELLAEALMRTKNRTAEPERLQKFISLLLNNCKHHTKLHERLSGLIKSEDLRQFYLNNFDVRSKLEPKVALRSMARATTVIGKIFESISTDRRVNTKYTTWIARLGQIFWALVEVSVPRSFFHLIFRHWLKLLYFLEVLLIIGSTLLLQQDVQRFAITAFGITAAIHLATAMLSDLIERRNRWIRLGKYFGGVIVVLLITLGGLTFSTFFGAHVIWEWIEKTRTWFVGHTRFLWLGTIVGVLLMMLWSIRNDVANLINGED